MNLIEQGRRCIHGGRSARRRLTTLLLVGALLVPVAVCLADVIVKANVRKTGNSQTAVFQLDFALRNVAGFPSCPTVVAAMVINSGEWAVINSLSQDEVSLDNIYASTAHVALLASELQTAGLYDPLTQALASESFIPHTCSGSTSEVVVEYTVYKMNFDPDPPVVEVVHPAKLVAGGATAADLKDGGSLTTFESVNQRVVQDAAIPAVSQWGLIALGLLLLAGARVYFGRRRSAA